MSIDKDNIKKAIEIGVYGVKDWQGKIRCFDHKLGYGKHVDLTYEEYEVYQKATHLSKEEQLKRLDEVLETKGGVR